MTVKKRIIYSYISNNETRGIVDYLNKEHQWSPVVFHGSLDMQPWVDKSFPDAKLIDSQSMRQSKFDYSILDNITPIDSEIIKNLSPYQSNFLSWLQDTTGWNFSFNERLRYYYDVLKYWNSIIEETKPDMFVSYTWPHVQSDFALYLLCKYHYKIPVLFLDIVPHLNANYFTVGCDMENLSAPFEKSYNSYSDSYLSNQVSTYLEKLRSDNPSTPKHVKDYFVFLDKKNKKQLIKLIKLIIGLFTGHSYARNEFYKKNKKPWGCKKSLLTVFEEFFFWKKISRKNKRLQKVYKSYIVEADFDKKYIYFAAPYQPEAISNVNQGCYEDPFLILDILTTVIPKDFMVYYKEHPNTFKDADKGALYRDEKYYQKLNSYINLRMISSDVDTFSLLDHSVCVATVGGTIGWESIVRGKPALVFGSIWYQACNGVFTITDLKSARNAVESILNGFKPNDKDVEKYAQAIFEACEKDIVTATAYDEKIKKCDNSKYEMERIARMFVFAENKYY